MVSSHHPPLPAVPWQNRLDLWLALALFALALGCYANTLSADLLAYYDDQEYVLNNPLIRDFSLNGLWQMWSQIYYQHYIPVTLMSYAIDYQIWGLNPFGYHLTNMLLHALNGVLVYLLGCQLQPYRVVAGLAAVIFVIHPLQVESVAWVSERKNLLSLWFFLLTMLVHIRNRQTSGSWRMSGMTWVCYSLALFAKPIVVGAPLLLMAYDYYWAHYTARRAVLSSFPLLILSASSVMSTLLGHQEVAAAQHYWENSPWYTALLMLRVGWDYFISLIAPLNLNTRYDYLLEDVVGNVRVGLGIVLLTVLIWMAWRQPLGKPLSRFALLWVFVLYLPVSNIIPFAVQRADRYFYFPAPGLLFILSMGIYQLWQWLAAPRARQLLVAAGGAILLGWLVLTVKRNTVWANSGSVWQDHLDDYPDSLTGLMLLGKYQFDQRAYAEAEATLRKMLRYQPRFAETYAYLGNIASATGRPHDAINWYQQAIRMRPQRAEYYRRLGDAYIKLGQTTEADRAYAQARALQAQGQVKRRQSQH